MADYAALKKGGFMRQKQKNNFSLRIRVVGGHLDAKQLAKVAEVSEKYGEGYVHLTSRQGVEIPLTYMAGGSSTNNGEAISGDPGASAQYAFSIELDFPANDTVEEVTRTLIVTANGGQAVQIAIVR